MWGAREHTQGTKIVHSPATVGFTSLGANFDVFLWCNGRARKYQRVTNYKREKLSFLDITPIYTSCYVSYWLYFHYRSCRQYLDSVKLIKLSDRIMYIEIQMQLSYGKYRYLFISIMLKAFSLIAYSVNNIASIFSIELHLCCLSFPLHL